MKYNLLKDKVAIITGSGRGMGRAITSLFSEEGAKVSISDINQEIIKKLKQEIKEKGNEVLYSITDVSDPKQVETMIKMTIKEFKKIDILVNNAAMTFVASASESTIEEWNKVINTTLNSVFYCSKYVIPYMLDNKGGAIINIASTVAFAATKRCAAYNAAKGGVVALTRQMALDYAPAIRVNAICPGWTDTEMAQEYITSRENPEMVKKEIFSTIPTGRLNTPEEIAYAALFLASDFTKNITGTTLVIDGGFLTQ